MPESKLVRIEVFIDGRHFYLISNYYRHDSAIERHIDPRGLVYFLRTKIAEHLGTALESTCVTRSHLFMGFLKEQKEELDTVRQSLSHKGVRLHAYPSKILPDGTPKEEGVDVALAITALRGAHKNEFDVAVLLSSDGDFIPLARELGLLEKRVILPYWDLLAMPNKKLSRRITTNIALIRASELPLNMRAVIDDGIKMKNPVIHEIFYYHNGHAPVTNPVPTVAEAPVIKKVPTPPPANTRKGKRERARPPKFDDVRQRGRIVQKTPNVGYIQPLEGKDKIPFLKYDLKYTDTEFDSLSTGSLVEYTVAKGARAGKDLATNLRIIAE